jgi:hypothetical protein
MRLIFLGVFSADILGIGQVSFFLGANFWSLVNLPLSAFGIHEFLFGRIESPGGFRVAFTVILRRLVCHESLLRNDEAAGSSTSPMPTIGRRHERL